MENLGQHFKSIRESKNLSLEDVSKALRISQVYLEAIEENKKELLPSRVYERIFLKAYADFLGLDFEETSTHFKELEATQELRFKLPKPAGKFKKYNWILVPVAFIVLLALLLLAARTQKLKESNLSEETAKMETLENLNLTPVTEDSLSAQAVLEKNREEAELSLKLVALDSSWLVIKADGIPIYSGIIYPQETREYQAKEKFYLHIGRPGAITVYLNGQEVKPRTLPKRTVHWELTKKNYQDFLVVSEAGGE